jgi:hypothetical protein
LAFINTKDTLASFWEHFPFLHRKTILIKIKINTLSDNKLISIKNSKMMKAIQIGILIFSCIYGAAAQQTFEKTYGTTFSEIAKSVRQTADGGYIIGGTNLVKVDSLGIEEWSKAIPSDFASLTSDNGYILIKNDNDITFTKVDVSGNTLWQTVYSEGHWANEGFHIEQTEDGGYIVTGRFQSVTGSGMLLLKLNANGGKIWRRTYSESTSAGFNGGFSVQETADSGFIMAGYANINFYDSTRHKDVFIVKTDSVGTEEWRKFFGGAADDLGAFVRQDNSGNYFISGTTNSYGIGTESNMYLMKIDSDGNTLWEKTYGGNLEEKGTGLWATNDGGCIMTGRSNSFSASGDFDGYIVKTDANGDTLWTKNYIGTGEDIIHSVQQTVDNGYIMAGATNSIGAGDFDMLLLKTDATGNWNNVSSTNGNHIPLANYSLFPNPNQGVFSIESEVEISSIEIFDVMGKRIYSKMINSNQATFDLSNQARGLYFYQLRIGNDSVLRTGKLVFD